MSKDLNKINEASDQTLRSIIDSILQSNVGMAADQYSKLMEICFTTNPDTGEKYPVYVPFHVPVNGAPTEIRLPLITLLPLSFLSVDKASITYPTNLPSTVGENSEGCNDNAVNITIGQQAIPQGLEILIKLLVSNIDVK